MTRRITKMLVPAIFKMVMMLTAIVKGGDGYGDKIMMMMMVDGVNMMMRRRRERRIELL